MKFTLAEGKQVVPAPERVSQCRLTIQYNMVTFDGMGYGEATTNRPVVRLSVACSFLMD